MGSKAHLVGHKGKRSRGKEVSVESNGNRVTAKHKVATSDDDNDDLSGTEFLKNHKDNSLSFAIKRGRGRPKKIGIVETNKKKYEARSYIGTAEFIKNLGILRQEIEVLHSDYQGSQGSLKALGRPRTRYLADTYIREQELQKFPLELRSKLGEYKRLKRFLPPKNRLGRPPKDLERNSMSATASPSAEDSRLFSPLPPHQHPHQHQHSPSSSPSTASSISTSASASASSSPSPSSPPSLQPPPVTPGYPSSLLTLYKVGSSIHSPVSYEPIIPSNKLTLEEDNNEDQEKDEEYGNNEMIQTVVPFSSTSANSSIDGEKQSKVVDGVKRKRGRPKKKDAAAAEASETPFPSIAAITTRKVEGDVNSIKKQRGRPKKNLTFNQQEGLIMGNTKKVRGRPRKYLLEESASSQQQRQELPKKKGNALKGRPRKYPIESTGSVRKTSDKHTSNPIPATTTTRMAADSTTTKRFRGRAALENGNTDVFDELQQHVSKDINTIGTVGHIESINENQWGFMKQNSKQSNPNIHVSKLYLKALLNPGLKDSN
ncbi:hypothetical protein PACTADRAFT_4516 [Pachysolen tannophilus NRRL Y-2460]|uniref:Uncharacterized protein n=1 Tax=Pachysolen tannophilus NRRL Y-2460 TaxID=669874 RepID=A0A1E4TPC5_PACTA|nr:hypothetical protein PACTADRAFT_4516 [Pachysolen tannophilus NRRL Y-2460]